MSVTVRVWCNQWVVGKGSGHAKCTKGVMVTVVGAGVGNKEEPAK